MAGLSTHVLDTSRGRPAGGVTIHVYVLEGNEPRFLKTVVTSADGRTEGPLLAAQELRAAVYQLVFCAGDYFRASGDLMPEPRFLDQVVIRFGVSNPGAHYHVPLLIAPYGYSTYRGS